MGYKRIVREIIRYLPKENTTYKKTHDGSLEVNLVDRDDSSFTVKKDHDWNYVKKLIDRITNLGKDCEICYIDYVKRHTCSECLNSFCGRCYVNIVYNNNGKLVCPYCSHTKRIIEEHKVEWFCEELSVYIDAELIYRENIGKMEKAKQIAKEAATGITAKSYTLKVTDSGEVTITILDKETITESESETTTATETVTENEACAKISCACGGKYSKKWEKIISTQKCIKNM